MNKLDENIVRELANLEKNAFHTFFCAKTKQELDDAKRAEKEFVGKLRKLSSSTIRRLNIEVAKRLAIDPEAPYIVRESSKKTLADLYKIRTASNKEVDEVLIREKKELAKKLVLLVSPQLLVEIPKVLEEGFAEVATKEQLEAAIKEVKPDNVKAKKGCLHVDVGSLSVVWSGPQIVNQE